MDTPGIVTFPAGSEDERVVSRLLVGDRHSAIVQVGDAKSVARSLLLLPVLAELRTPTTLALNMADEARAHGVRIDLDALRKRLGIPVVLTVATSGAGLDELGQEARKSTALPRRIAYPAPVEDVLAEVERHLPDGPVPARALGLLWLAGDEEAGARLAGQVDERVLDHLERLREEADLLLGGSAAVAIQSAWLSFADEVASSAVSVRDPRSTEPRLARLARLTTHRLWGWPILLAVLGGIYAFVGLLGAGTLVGFVEGRVFADNLNPFVTGVVERVLPVRILDDLLVGEYGLWTMGMTYALALILPIVTTFFLVFSALEDSGYLPRLAVVSNRIFARLGLNGKAALPMVLGLGCVTMATLTTRILDSKRERMLATMLLALGIPCSAQLGVVLGMLGSISLVATLIWSGVVAAIVLGVGALAARLVPGERTGCSWSCPRCGFLGPGTSP